MEDVDQDDILGFGGLAKVRDELKEKYETFEWDNSKGKQELVELRKKVELSDSL